MNFSHRLQEAEKQTRLALSGLSVLRQLSEKLELPTGQALIEELVALARAQRRALCAAHRQLEGNPLLAHLLKSRISYRWEDEHGTKSGKRLEDLIRSTYFVATTLHFRGDIHDWRKLLAIFAK